MTSTRAKAQHNIKHSGPFLRHDLAHFYSAIDSRKGDPSRDARYVYNHIQCAPMLFWLAEASGVNEAQLSDAFEAVLDASASNAAQCAAFRRLVPWETLVLNLPKPTWRDTMRTTFSKVFQG